MQRDGEEDEQGDKEEDRQGDEEKGGIQPLSFIVSPLHSPTV